MDRIDTLVIGAGVVGLAVARACAQAGQEVIVAEAQSGIGQGVSSRNSEVIHAGLYYAPGSLKAKLCVRGKALLYALCESHGVAHRACGKWVVAQSDAECESLRTLQQRAERNGVPTRWLGGAEAQAIEPALRCVAALESPTTGIVDSHGFMLALQGDLEAAGGAVALQSRVDAVQLMADAGQHVVRLADGSEFLVRRLVNAAGIDAPAVATAMKGVDASRWPRAQYAKGSYFSLAAAAPFSRLIYPAPADAWLGVHLTLDLGGQARFGPDLEWLDVSNSSEIDYQVDPRRADGFYAEVRRYWPALPDGALLPAYSGVRPKIHAPGTLAPDFRIEGPADHGVPGLVQLFGIESPGLTSSMAIGQWVTGLLSAPAP